ncbi:hypothetical protein E2C01_004256 [Portunus trituberculatus]|uniref:Uncharacterized protein n=1 Tax=Portunus trituberculatus TaxID=210409 RepID=A0A5B7CR58_PORTR|nr:hypothetical protein [Portunus trituberculatus]
MMLPLLKIHRGRKIEPGRTREGYKAYSFSMVEYTSSAPCPVLPPALTTGTVQCCTWSSGASHLLLAAQSTSSRPCLPACVAAGATLTLRQERTDSHVLML